MKLALSPGFIGTCRIRNRFVMPAANLGWCTDGFVSEKVVSFYQKRARGGTGLIIAGAAGVDPVRINRAGMMQICDDRFIPAMERLRLTIDELEQNAAREHWPYPTYADLMFSI